MAEIVQLRAEHAAEYRELMLHAYREAPNAFTATPEERADLPLSWWAERIAGSGTAFGAFEDGLLVGAVALEGSPRPKTRHKAHLVGMYVLAAWRGQGIGRRLVQAVLDHARQRPDLKVLTLTVTEDNTDAIALYQAAGFHAFGLEPMALRTEDGYRGKLHMWQALAAP